MAEASASSLQSPETEKASTPRGTLMFHAGSRRGLDISLNGYFDGPRRGGNSVTIPSCIQGRNAVPA
jgi:hypothetical protein